MPSHHDLALLAAVGAAVVFAWNLGRNSRPWAGQSAAEPSPSPSPCAPPAANSLPGILVITGASKGIGLATAKRFLASGWRVLNLSRSPCPLAGVVHRQCDLGAPGWEAGLAAWAAEELGLAPGAANRICLVHNAAVMVRDSALCPDGDAMLRSFAINVVAPAVLNGVFSPAMGPGSSILYIGSTLSEKGVPGSASYVASKHAVAGLMKVTTQDLKGRDGVHSCCVCPGFTATEMLVAHLGSDPAVRDMILGMQTMGRLLETSEIADVVHFCALNPSVNGTVLHANLGQVER